MSVGIFMTTYNMLSMTQRAVKSLRESMGGYPYHFLIQDHRSTDGTEKWCKEEGINYQTDSHQNSLAAALNQAVHFFVDGKFPDVEFISFVHNDMTFYPGWAEAVVEFSKETGIQGKISSENPRILGFKEGESEKICAKMREFPRWSFRPGNECPSTFNVEIFTKSGIFFDENFQGIGGYEDWDFNRVLIQHGYKVGILSNSLVWHDSMGTRKHLDQLKEGQYNAGYYFQKWGDNKNVR